jgi:hypothetical protein
MISGSEGVDLDLIQADLDREIPITARDPHHDLR